MDEASPTHNCRICGISITDGELIHLFQNAQSRQKQLTISGELYEELMGIDLFFFEPACICSSCDLQMKLFKRLKEKALITQEKLLLQVNGNTTGSIVKESQDVEEIDCIEYREEFSDNENVVNLLLVYENSYNNLIEVDEKSNILSFEQKVQKHIKDIDDFVEIQYLESENEEPKNFLEKESNYLTNLYQKPVIKDADFILFKCRECNINFRNIQLLQLHSQKNHPLIHRCTKCSKKFRSVEALDVHLNQHLGLPAYSCNKCHKTFKQKVHYQYHIKRHNDERNFKCSDCGKRYVTKSDLNVHMRQHSGIRPYTCTVEINSGICGKKCYTQQHLKMHMYCHAKSNSFECNICHQKFVSPTVLHTHQKSIHLERRFECMICGKKFRRKHHLEIHILTHQKKSVIRVKDLHPESVDTFPDDNEKTLGSETQAAKNLNDDSIQIDEQNHKAHTNIFVKNVIGNY